MNFFESIRVALSALYANKMRSLLTMLGVIIGVGAVIIMISIVQGARQSAVDQFKGDGANIVFAFFAPKPDKRSRGKFEGLVAADLTAIQNQVTTVSDVSPVVEQSVRLREGKRELSATFEGVKSSYPDLNNVELEQGRFIEANDDTDWAKTCVLGDAVRRKLFGKGDAIGKTVVVEKDDVRLPFTVVGTLKHKKAGFGPGVDDQIFGSIATIQKRILGTTTITNFSARATGTDAENAADQIFAVLKQRHPDHAKDFVIDTQEGLISRLDSLLLIFQLILGGVGGLSLLVGGIGIMNIMLVTVTERTREIGIRKAVGAQRGDIMLQFVTESMTVSGVGGILGVGFGYGAATLIGAVAGDKLHTFVPLWAALLGFGFAVGVGMFFGIYPAVRASKLDPIQALRYE